MKKIKFTVTGDASTVSRRLVDRLNVDRLNIIKRERFIIVGGVAGGATAAARLRRLDEYADIVLFERGSHVSFANCGLPYYVGETIKERSRLLVQTPERMKARFDIDIRVNSEVIGVDVENSEVIVQGPERRYKMRFDALILAPGSKPLRPKIPGIDHPKILTLRSLNDAELIKKFTDKSAQRNGSVTIIGGGFIGVEMAENLRKRGLSVTLVDAVSQVLSVFDEDIAAYAKIELIKNGVDLVLGHAVSSFEDSLGRVVSILDDGQKIESDFVLLCIGVVPDTDFLKGSGIELDERGYICVDSSMRTNECGIYAVGDAIKLYRFSDKAPMTLALAGPANYQGRRAADSVGGRFVKMGGFQGTSIVKVFSQTLACTGLNSRVLDREQKKYHTVIAHPLSHAGYYPGGSQMTLKLLFDENGMVLGAQAAGSEGVDKRIDVLAAMIHQYAHIWDLMDLELAYAPPFSSAKDPVNMVGYMAEDVLTKLTHPILFKDLAKELKRGVHLIDVRTKAEFEAGHLDGAENIPLETIRDNIDKFNRSEEYIVYCQVGQRGYYAERILSGHGIYYVRNLAGGYKSACMGMV